MDKKKLLFFTYCFPPMALPRAIQISRIASAINASVVVICAEDQHERKDTTITCSKDQHSIEIIRRPFNRSKILHYLDALSDRCDFMWSHLPDMYRGWVKKMVKEYLEYQKNQKYNADVLITCAQPMSDHLFGLAYKKRCNTPWIAHFSDPWVDNPYRKNNIITAGINAYMERQVIVQADAVIFTSPDTRDCVMKKYPAAMRAKAFYLPHCYDKNLYEKTLLPKSDPYIIRHIGNFYGNRSPLPVLAAVEHISNTNPQLLDRVSIEFIGVRQNKHETAIKKFSHLNKYVSYKQPVSYAESLRLMQTAHCLVVLDAPAERSLFFPSKLVDYIGAGRYICAITPQGHTADIVRAGGGIVADPSDANACASALKKILQQRPSSLPKEINEFEKDTVAKEFERIIETVLHAKKR